jgi:hypothetical protein
MDDLDQGAMKTHARRRLAEINTKREMMPWPLKEAEGANKRHYLRE